VPPTTTTKLIEKNKRAYCVLVGEEKGDVHAQKCLETTVFFHNYAASIPH